MKQGPEGSADYWLLFGAGGELGAAVFVHLIIIVPGPLPHLIVEEKGSERLQKQSVKLLWLLKPAGSAITPTLA